MDLYTLIKDNITISWWQMLLIGLFFLILNLVIFIATWYVHKECIVEYGYPKRNAKAMKKITSQYSLLDNLLLIRITKMAERQGFFLYLNLACHFASILGYLLCIVGFCGSMVTLADGWALTMLVGSQLAVLFFTVLIEFVPHLIWLPSERKRYKP